DQPLLIVQGALDTEFPVANADRLEALSRGRTKLPASATTKVIVPDVNHRLVLATTGELDEYESLKSRTVAPQVTDALVTWLRGVFTSRKKEQRRSSILIRVVDVTPSHHHDARREDLFDLDRSLVTREHVAQAPIDLRRFVGAAAAQDDAAAGEIALHGVE